MTGPLRILDRDVLAVRPITSFATAGNTCSLPAPRLGEICSLPAGHQPTDVHEVQVLALVTIDRFTTDTENPMRPDPETPEALAAAARRRQEARAAKPRAPRDRPTEPRTVVPPATGEQR